MKHACLPCLLLLSLTLTQPLSLSAQNTIQGHVIDGETNSPLPGANVFIAKTTKGVSTNIDGAFVITGLPAVHFQLVVSFVGYETQVFDVVPGQPVTYKVILKPSARRLGEVIVRARSSRSEWLTNLAMFKEHFIGLSDNANLCTIENPDILDFKNKERILTANVDSVLYILNKGLGYRLKVVIDKYEFNQLKAHLFYQGNLVYEALTPADENEKKVWAQNRLKAYYGSEMHFFRSLYHRHLIEEGYVFNIILTRNGFREGIADTTMRIKSKINNDKFVKVKTLFNYYHILDSAASTPENPVLNYTGDLEIKYMNEAENFEYSRHNGGRGGSNSHTPQRSIIKLVSPAVVQSNGQLYPPEAIVTQGFWSWELVSEDLPLDYNPGDDRKILGLE